MASSDRGRRLVHPQPGGRRHVAVRVRAGHGHRGWRTTTSCATRAWRWASTWRRRRRSRARSSRPTAGWRGRSTGSLERDDWSAVTDEGQTSAGTTALLVAGLVERRTLTNDTRHDEVLRRLGASSWPRPSRREPCSRPTTTPQAHPSPACTRSTTPGRRTGRSPVSIDCSPTKAGARSPTGSAPTWPPSATRSRTSGRPCPITGRPTGWPRPSPSTTGRASARSRRTSSPTPAARRGSSAPRSAG